MLYADKLKGVGVFFLFLSVVIFPQQASASVVPWVRHALSVQETPRVLPQNDCSSRTADLPVGSAFNANKVHVDSVSISNDGSKIAVSGAKALLVSVDGGQTWTDRTQEAPDGAWFSNVFTGDGSKLIGGSAGTNFLLPSKFNSIAVSTDAGVSWERLSAPASPILAGGDCKHLNGPLFSLTDDGKKLLYINLWNDGGGNGSSYGEGGVGIGGNGGYGNGYDQADKVMLSSDGGVTWTTALRLPFNNDFSRRSTVAYAQNGSTIMLGTIDGFYVSKDGGATWVKHALSGTTQVAVSADGSKLVAGAIGAGTDAWTYLNVSIDGGQTWQQQVAGGKKAWESLAMSGDGSTLVAQFDTPAANLASYRTHEVAISKDLGQTWLDQGRAMDGDPLYYSVGISRDGSKVAVVGSKTTNNPDYFVTHTSADSQLFSTYVDVATVPSNVSAAVSCPVITRDLTLGDKDTLSSNQSFVTDASVSELQKFLTTHFGVVTDPIDSIGTYGAGTVSYVKRFQSEQGIVASGKVGTRTRAAIQKVCYSIPSYSNTTYQQTTPAPSGAVASVSRSATVVTGTSNLSSSQISSILDLLQSFGADQSVIQNVASALGGSSSATVVSPQVTQVVPVTQVAAPVTILATSTVAANVSSASGTATITGSPITSFYALPVITGRYTGMVNLKVVIATPNSSAILTMTEGDDFFSKTLGRNCTSAAPCGIWTAGFNAQSAVAPLPNGTYTINVVDTNTGTILAIGSITIDAPVPTTSKGSLAGYANNETSAFLTNSAITQSDALAQCRSLAAQNAWALRCVWNGAEIFNNNTAPVVSPVGASNPVVAAKPTPAAVDAQHEAELATLMQVIEAYRVAHGQYPVGNPDGSNLISRISAAIAPYGVVPQDLIADGDQYVSFNNRAFAILVHLQTPIANPTNPSVNPSSWCVTGVGFSGSGWWQPPYPVCTFSTTHPTPSVISRLQDTQRGVAIVALANILEAYKKDKGVYPPADGSPESLYTVAPLLASYGAVSPDLIAEGDRLVSNGGSSYAFLVHTDTPTPGSPDNWCRSGVNYATSGWWGNAPALPDCSFQPTVPAAATTTSMAPIVHTLAAGWTGGEVSTLQSVLTKLGLLKTGVTGYFGQATKTAVQNFQSANNIAAVGIVGPKTRNLLLQTLGF